MLIKSVTAQAFGPLLNESLELSPGLTVIHGDNESGKSSWHAAIYAALCGRRRGKGSSLAEREFALRRRPWNGERWHVSGEVQLDDGRSVTLEHDLDGKVACRALDNRGRDVSSDIMYEGAPDGSRWLGLNRRTFAATACVNQAELLRVLDAADALQTDIQRAAATAGKAETAAAALEALRAYTSEHVGKDQVNSKRPLRRAVTELEQARAAAAAACRAHEDYLRLAACAEEAAAAVVDARATRKSAEAAETSAERLLQAAEVLATAQQAAAEAATRADERRASAAAGRVRQERAHELAAAAPRTEPAGGNEGDAVAQQVSRALGGWESAPQVSHPTGPSAGQLQAQLDVLPPVPDGDVVVDPAVERLRDAYLQAAAVLDRGDRGRVDHPDVSDSIVAAAVAFGVANLYRMADRLAAPPAEVDPQFEAAVAETARRRAAVAAGLRAAEQRAAEALSVPAAGSQHARSGTPRRTALTFAAVAGALLAVIGVILVLAGQRALAAGLIVAGPCVWAVALLVRRFAGGEVAAGGAVDAGPSVRFASVRRDLGRAREESLRAERAHLEAETRLASARRAASISAANWRAAADEAHAAGLPSDPAELRILADRAQRVVSQREACERWRRDRDTDEGALRAAEQRLTWALADRGHLAEGDDDVLTSFVSYEDACTRRAEQARQARRRASLQEQLDARIEVEATTERARQTRRAAAEVLQGAARAAGIVSGQEASEAAAGPLVERLRQWLTERTVALDEAERQRRAWLELRTLLAGSSLEELDSEVAREISAAEAAELRAGLARADVGRLGEQLQAAATEAGVDVPADAATARGLLGARRTAVTQARESERQVCEEAARQRGKVAEREAAVPSVAEAEEAVERAQRELDRVRSLEHVLKLTVSYLETAQEQTYNTLAPVLGSALERWLPEVTAGRYERACVDPETLEVKVATATGSMRSADRLSVGTAEQIYLLLRVALAEHLAHRSTVSPLLLDDVTVQADPVRTEAIMRMCKALADEGRQVIVFAQEPAVAAWAEEHLHGARDALIRLPVRIAA